MVLGIAKALMLPPQFHPQGWAIGFFWFQGLSLSFVFHFLLEFFILKGFFFSFVFFFVISGCFCLELNVDFDSACSINSQEWVLAKENEKYILYFGSGHLM